MEQRRGRDEPTFERSATPVKRSRRRRLTLICKTTYTVDELPALLDRLRHQEASAEEIERRTRVVERIERLRAKLPPIETPVDEWLRRAREDMMDG
ncbi:MAG: hypothetical protein HY331_18135 [Chloroflexi bacterium]|nr:hypothetical protein [Chloroflexota bacterium]